MSEDTTHGAAVPDEVRARLTAALGSDDIIVTDAGAARLPTGGTAREPGQGPGNPFVPDFGPGDPVHERAPREPVTIEPKTTEGQFFALHELSTNAAIVAQTHLPGRQGTVGMGVTTLHGGHHRGLTRGGPPW